MIVTFVGVDAAPYALHTAVLKAEVTLPGGAVVQTEATIFLRDDF